jgi:hypothetical protein
MATVFQTKDRKNTWRIQIELGRDPVTNNWLVHYETVKGSKTDARRRGTELQHKLDNGTIVNPSDYTLKELLQDWLRIAGSRIPESGRKRATR